MVSVFPFFGEPAGYSFDATFGSQEILARLQGAWWFLALFVFQAAFNTILGEEFLFRGVLLPKMEGVFGRFSWVANGVLFGLYHLHQPWGIPNGILTGLLYTYPAYRYRSTWMSILLHITRRACTSPFWCSESCWGWLRSSEREPSKA